MIEKIRTFLPLLSSPLTFIIYTLILVGCSVYFVYYARETAKKAKDFVNLHNPKSIHALNYLYTALNFLIVAIVAGRSPWWVSLIALVTMIYLVVKIFKNSPDAGNIISAAIPVIFLFAMTYYDYYYLLDLKVLTENLFQVLILVYAIYLVYVMNFRVENTFASNIIVGALIVGYRFWGITPRESLCFVLNPESMTCVTTFIDSFYVSMGLVVFILLFMIIDRDAKDMHKKILTLSILLWFNLVAPDFIYMKFVGDLPQNYSIIIPLWTLYFVMIFMSSLYLKSSKNVFTNKKDNLLIILMKMVTLMVLVWASWVMAI